MRVLVTSQPGPEHLGCVASLARALTASGHDVDVASSPALSPWVESIGLHPLPLGAPWSTAKPWELVGMPAPSTPAEERSLLAKASAKATLALLPALMARISTCRPDLVIHDQCELAGAIAAEANGIPCVRFEHTASPDAADIGSLLSAKLRRKLGMGTQRTRSWRYLTVDSLPPVLKALPCDNDTSRWRIRPELLQADPQTVPPRWHEPRVGARVLVVLRNRPREHDAVTLPLLSALAQRGSDLVVMGAPVPVSARSWARETRYAPLAALLPGADLVVTDGACGLTLAVLSSGVPLMIIPQHDEHTYIAHRVSGAGAGITVSVDQLRQGAVGRELDKLLTEPLFRANAQRLAGHISAMPAAREVADRLALL